MHKHTRNLLAAALDTAARGWPVFPLARRSKKPALHSEQDCHRTGLCASGHLGWEQRATTDPDRIRTCWTAGDWNIGLATGPAGLLVIDLDMPKSPDEVLPDGWNRRGVRTGEDVLALVCERAGQPMPAETRTVATPSGGLHLYFALPKGVQLRNTQGEKGAGLGPLIDTRAGGGYVIAPGSTTPNGTYELVSDHPVAQAPGWLVQALTPKPPTAISAASQVAADRMPSYVRAAVAGECTKVRAAQRHAHQNTLYWAGIALGQLVGSGDLPAATAESALFAAAGHIIGGPCRCTAAMVIRNIQNGLRDGQKRPRVRREKPPAETSALFAAPDRGAA
ncbi:bifunctional DNA primase/polymerase [Crossiella sp. SN42]|uniref:bifunctional DNA primase/polymerase n=1 Tax=Crossiella sp. SN42 TaxID=2944808 RepID=UPI00207C369B|nr:bifunctional DNA primase/polymerase [Crossiella sp. SN42]MCO1582033.1 bifunctional DNA primase/polymerase [Crossiella sp. SN42]